MCTISKCGYNHVQNFVNLEDVSGKQNVALWLTHHFVCRSKSPFTFVNGDFDQQTRKKIIFGREPELEFRNVRTIYLDKLRVIREYIIVFHVKCSETGIHLSLFFTTTKQFQVFFFKTLISEKCPDFTSKMSGN